MREKKKQETQNAVGKSPGTRKKITGKGGEGKMIFPRERSRQGWRYLVRTREIQKVFREATKTTKSKEEVKEKETDLAGFTSEKGKSSVTGGAVKGS